MDRWQHLGCVAACRGAARTCGLALIPLIPPIALAASLGTFQQMWLSKAEYEDEGATAIERKCLF